MTKWDKLQNELKILVAEKEAALKPYEDKLEVLSLEILDLSYAEVRQWIKEGKRIGRRWHWCSPYEEWNPNEWETRSWPSQDAWMKNVQASWYTINEEDIKTLEEIHGMDER